MVTGGLGGGYEGTGAGWAVTSEQWRALKLVLNKTHSHSHDSQYPAKEEVCVCVCVCVRPVVILLSSQQAPHVKLAVLIQALRSGSP
ncbi:hypothetical protein E2C01_024400 [Portunus trituberculatus]|uniref:Uncharacterized protein n=1 Tax=Portunus trituberculatus TaxID=210409 RepID=A0A5B7EAJ5_PORTR|nr:hypothetical protein [Portunus trituberculatus]